MRLLSHRDPATGARSFGVVELDHVITAPELASVGGLDETDALLDTHWLLSSDEWHTRVKDAHRKCKAAGLVGRHLREFTPAAAIQTPEKIVCVGLNYREHVAEGGRAAPERPLLFAKFANSVVADGTRSSIPPAATRSISRPSSASSSGSGPGTWRRPMRTNTSRATWSRTTSRPVTGRA